MIDEARKIPEHVKQELFEVYGALMQGVRRVEETMEVAWWGVESESRSDANSSSDTDVPAAMGGTEAFSRSTSTSTSMSSSSLSLLDGGEQGTASTKT